MNCFCKTTASARLGLYLKRLYFISSAIAYCILPYAYFYAGLSCSKFESCNLNKYASFFCFLQKERDLELEMGEDYYLDLKSKFFVILLIFGLTLV